MKFKKAIFKNFRILRNVELDFSTDSSRHLTVIRAENESGKTTTLIVLQWALYGDEALPAKGKDYRLHPIDWDLKGEHRVPIEVTLEFEHTTENRTPDGKWREDTKTYRITRTTVEELAGNDWTRRPSNVTLFELTSRGASPIEPPEPFLHDILPSHLREVFFTDGDRALSFIEAEVSTATKRQRVQNAVKSLLGLGVIEKTKSHVNEAIRDTNSKIRNEEGSAELKKVSENLEQIRAELEEYKTKLDEATEQLTMVELQLSETEKEIMAVLQRGDEEYLRKELESTKKRIQQLEKSEFELEQNHSSLFKDASLAIAILREYLIEANSKLNSLKKQGTIPRNAIPILKERLDIGRCFCGESLAEGLKRRQILINLIKDQQERDDFLNQLTDLYYQSRSYIDEIQASKPIWVKNYQILANQRFAVSDDLAEERAKYKGLEHQLEHLGDTDIAALRHKRKELDEIKINLAREQTRIQTHIGGLTKEEKEQKVKQGELLRNQERYKRYLSDQQASEDILGVLEQAYQTILDDELAMVSKTMNDYFLKMIVVDPEQGAIIQRAEITREFDIKVYGPEDRQLDPDRDLNGASRRALTLSFILALTQVSQVIAPNIIDTPLGMTSGHVKRSVLKTTIEQSTQLVLFLTRSEIEGCQDIIDEYSGKVITFTNTAHYPPMLKNNPGIPDRMILRCDCNHRQICKICERQGDSEDNRLKYR